MEIHLNMPYTQFLTIVRQMPISYWNRLKNDMEKIYFIKKHPASTKERPFGVLKGELWIADDFDAPLDDFKEYM